MPLRPAKYCAEPSCSAKVRPPLRFCKTHRSIHTRRRLGPPQAFRIYDSPAWRALRARVLREEPVCRLCGINPSRDADHIIPVDQGGAPYDRDNVQGLCRPCHVAKTRAQAS